MAKSAEKEEKVANRDQSHKKDINYIRAKSEAEAFVTKYRFEKANIRAWVKQQMEEKLDDLEEELIMNLANVIQYSNRKNDIRELLGINDWNRVTEYWLKANRVIEAHKRFIGKLEIGANNNGK